MLETLFAFSFSSFLFILGNKCKRLFGKNEAVFVGDDGLPFCEEHAPESSEEGETGDPTYSTSEVD